MSKLEDLVVNLERKIKRKKERIGILSKEIEVLKNKLSETDLCYVISDKLKKRRR